MQQFNISLKYCHGISKLDYCFDFSSGKDYVIYAQNGSMKTSLYNTIYEFKNLLPTQDVFFPKRETKRKIVDENGNDIPAKSIVCVGNNDFDLPTDNISSLLVNEKLKKRYDQIATSYDKYMKQINRVFKSISGESIDTLLLDLRIDNINLIPADMFKKENILEQFEGLKYKKFFNDDYLGNLKSESVISAVNDYIAFCNKIVDEYPIFIKDIFELHNLKSINKSAESNNYFVAGHQLLLYDKKSNEYDRLKLCNQVCFPLYACSKELVRQYGPYLKELNLTYTQYIVMLVLWEEDDVSVGHLCSRLHLDSGTLTPLLKKLQEAGLLLRRRNPQDERVVQVLLTEKGRALRQMAVGIPQRVGACMNLQREEAEKLYTLLYRILGDRESGE